MGQGFFFNKKQLSLMYKIYKKGLESKPQELLKIYIVGQKRWKTVRAVERRHLHQITAWNKCAENNYFKGGYQKISSGTGPF